MLIFIKFVCVFEIEKNIRDPVFNVYKWVEYECSYLYFTIIGSKIIISTRSLTAAVPLFIYFSRLANSAISNLLALSRRPPIRGRTAR